MVAHHKRAEEGLTWYKTGKYTELVSLGLF